MFDQYLASCVLDWVNVGIFGDGTICARHVANGIKGGREGLAVILHHGLLV